MRTRSPGKATEGRRPCPSGSRFRAVAEVVVAPGARRLGDDLDRASVAREFDHRLPLRVECVERERLPVDAACVQVGERLSEPAEVLGS